MKFLKGVHVSRHIQWCAPEFIRFEVTSNSDIWSLGCLITILIHIKYLCKGEEIEAVNLLKIKEDAYHYKLSAKEIETHKELFTILSKMMKINPNERITFDNLLKEPFIQTLLRHTNPQLIMRVKRCIVTEADRPFPINDSMEVKLIYLTTNWKHENCVQKALYWFTEYINMDKNVKLSSELLFLLFQIMSLHQFNVSIIIYCLTILVYIVETEQIEGFLTETQYFYIDDTVKLSNISSNENNIWKINDLNTVLLIMKKYLHHLTIQNLGLKFLYQLIYPKHFTINMNMIQNYLKIYKNIFKKLQKINLSYHILEMLNSSSKDLIKIAMHYLWKFCIYEPIAQEIAERGVLLITVQFMQSNQSDCEIFTNGSLVIVSLLRIDLAVKHIMEYNSLIPMLLQGLLNFKDFPNTIWNICLCLQVVLHLSEEFALQFINKQKGIATMDCGFDILYSIYKIHYNNTLVIEALLKPIKSVVQYDFLVTGDFSTLELLLTSIMKSEDADL
ncbi:unnamed protein product [Heterobilharzia americana]|nr:unnamed protein product [Heterobilharzia americana]